MGGVPADKAPCFVDFAGWLETRRNLGKVLGAWSRGARRLRCLLGAQVLVLVRRWQREKWSTWSEVLRARSCSRGAFTTWARVVVPYLVDSSAEEAPSEAPSETSSETSSEE